MRLKERQREILQAALDLLAQGGSKALTTRNLAARLGITEPAIYRHFSSKRELLLALYDYVWWVLEARLSQALEKVVGFEARLSTFLSSLLCFLEENRGVNLVLLSEAIYQDDPSLKVALLEVFGGIQEMLKGILEEGVSEGVVKSGLPLDTVARMVMGFVQVNLTAYLLSGEGLEVEMLVRDFVRLLMEGVRR